MPRTGLVWQDSGIRNSLSMSLWRNCNVIPARSAGFGFGTSAPSPPSPSSSPSPSPKRKVAGERQFFSGPAQGCAAGWLRERQFSWGPCRRAVPQAGSARGPRERRLLYFCRGALRAGIQHAHNARHSVFCGRACSCFWSALAVLYGLKLALAWLG